MNDGLWEMVRWERRIMWSELKGLSRLTGRDGREVGIGKDYNLRVSARLKWTGTHCD